VQLTCGSLRVFQVFFSLRAFSCSQALSTPTHTQLTPAVSCFAGNTAQNRVSQKLEFIVWQSFFSGGFGWLLFLVHFVSGFSIYRFPKLGFVSSIFVFAVGQSFW
jgi:hypothetical protein